MLKRLIKKLKSRIYILTVWAIIISASTLIVTTTFAATIYNIKEKELVVVNYYNTPIEVKINGDIFLVENFDIFTKKIRTDRDIVLETIDSEGKTIDKIKFDNLGLQSKLILNIASRNSVYCFAQGNVKPLYYNLNNGSNFDSFSVLTNFAKNTYLGTLAADSLYVYPGNSTLENLPSEIGNENLTGIYPINCNDLNEEKFKETVELFKQYNPIEQREFYKKESERINNSTTLEELLD